MPHRVMSIVSIAFAAASSADAQQGRADLQYRAPVPASITYVTVDSARTRTSGLPTGDMTTTAHFRSVSEVSFAPADSGLQATITVKEFKGTTSSPMGDVPMNASSVAPLTLTITATGPRQEELVENPPVAGTSPGDVMGAARAYSGLLILPGRELARGESWTDSTSMTPDVDGIRSSVTTITRGTYAADTIVDGATLNVLRIVTEIRMTASGTVQGMSMTQNMTSTSDEQVLWDSARHYVASRDASGTFRGETVVANMGMTMVMTGTTRSVTTAHVEE